MHLNDESGVDFLLEEGLCVGHHLSGQNDHRGRSIACFLVLKNSKSHFFIKF